ncbi:MAG: hypothetical protein IV097_00470 [Burkholderiaceae bacterium]|nr:hypothetical protein [Burkholderiaceae bacterium]
MSSQYFKKVPLAVVVVATFVALSAHATDNEKCYPTKMDPGANRNDNKPGTACHKQVAKVRKLEFDPRFDCTKSIRQQWQRESDIADKMGCNL